MAEMLGQPDVSDALQETLDEETAADELLSEIADSIINGEAISEEETPAEEEEEIQEGA